AAEQDFAVRMEGQACDASTVPDRLADHLTVAGLPEPDTAVRASRGNHLSVGAEGGGVDDGVVAQNWSLRLPRIRLPQPDDVVARARQQAATIGTVQGTMPVRVVISSCQGGTEQLLSVHVPETDFLPRIEQQRVAIGTECHFGRDELGQG